MMNGPQFILPQLTGLLSLEVMLESYHKLQLKPITVPVFKDPLQLICSALSEKAIYKIAYQRYCMISCRLMQAILLNFS